jgi:hypothetical protein
VTGAPFAGGSVHVDFRLCELLVQDLGQQCTESLLLAGAQPVSQWPHQLVDAGDYAGCEACRRRPADRHRALISDAVGTVVRTDTEVTQAN